MTGCQTLCQLRLSMLTRKLCSLRISEAQYWNARGGTLHANRCSSLGRERNSPSGCSPAVRRGECCSIGRCSTPGLRAPQLAPIHHVSGEKQWMGGGGVYSHFLTLGRDCKRPQTPLRKRVGCRGHGWIRIVRASINISTHRSMPVSNLVGCSCVAKSGRTSMNPATISILGRRRGDSRVRSHMHSFACIHACKYACEHELLLCFCRFLFGHICRPRLAGNGSQPFGARARSASPRLRGPPPGRRGAPAHAGGHVAVRWRGDGGKAAGRPVGGQARRLLGDAVVGECVPRSSPTRARVAACWPRASGGGADGRSVSRT